MADEVRMTRLEHHLAVIGTTPVVTTRLGGSITPDMTAWSVNLERFASLRRRLVDGVPSTTTGGWNVQVDGHYLEITAVTSACDVVLRLLVPDTSVPMGPDRERMIDALWLAEACMSLCDSSPDEQETIDAINGRGSLLDLMTANGRSQELQSTTPTPWTPGSDMMTLTPQWLAMKPLDPIPDAPMCIGLSMSGEARNNASSSKIMRLSIGGHCSVSPDMQDAVTRLRCEAAWQRHLAKTAS